MSVQIGTAEDNVDLVQKLLTFISTDSSLVANGENWEILRNAAFPFPQPWPGRLAFHSNRAAYTTTAPDAPPNYLPTTWFKFKAVGTLIVPTTGTYAFSLLADTQAFIRIDGTVVGGVFANNFANTFPQTFAIDLDAGNHAFEVVFMQSSVTTFGLSFAWKKPGDASFSIVPTSNYSNMSCAIGRSSTLNPSLQDMLAIERDVQCVVKGPGTAGNDEIYVNLQTVSSVQSDAYNIRISYSVGYNPLLNNVDQPGVGEAHYFLGWNQVTPYWFVASGRCLKVIGKISTTYSNMYGGFFLPYALPSEFPYPVIAGANSIDNIRWSDRSYKNSSFWNPSFALRTDSTYGTCLTMRRTDGSIGYFFNYAETVPSTYQARGVTYPYAYGATYRSETGLLDFRTAPDGSYALQPIVLTSPTNGINVFGELDGVFHVSGFNNASENIISLEGVDYLVVQSAFRTRASDYAAIRLE